MSRFNPQAIESEFQGKPTIQIFSEPGDPRPFSFGVFKAKMILALIPEIKAFVERHDQRRTAPRPPAPAEPRSYTPSDQIGFGDPPLKDLPAPAAPPTYTSPPATGERVPSYTRPPASYPR